MKILLLFIVLSLSVFNAAAKKLYKFQDKDGGWHFTDKPPQTEQKVTVSQLKVEPKQMVWLQQAGEERHPQYTLRNDYAGPVEVEVGFAENDNAQSVPELPARFIVQPGQSDPLFQIGGIREDQSIRYKLTYRYVPGRPLENYAPPAPYYPPIGRGETFRISQAFNGEFSHRDEQNKYAVDIAMPEGTPVYAARSGTVMEVADDFFNSGYDVVMSGIDTTEALVEAKKMQAAGKQAWAVAYDYKTNCSVAPEICLGVPYFNWGPAYVGAIKQAMDGTWQEGFQWNAPDWTDINNPDTSAVGFTKGDGLSADASSQLDGFIAELAGGLDLWTGPINLQDGTSYLADGTAATDAQIWYLPQLLQGMEGQSVSQ